MGCGTTPDPLSFPYLSTPYLSRPLILRRPFAFVPDPLSFVRFLTRSFCRWRYRKSTRFRVRVHLMAVQPDSRYHRLTRSCCQLAELSLPRTGAADRKSSPRICPEGKLES